jgi:cation diffusion facilitator CzcD-associated flavoprotein CzcO
VGTLRATRRFCIIGAGSSGLAVARHFRAFGIAFDCVEREDDVGGNWYYGKPHSSVFRSTRLISSKRQTQFTDFPMPDAWPEHPGQELVFAYLRKYAEYFDLYSSIQFNTSVHRIEPAGKQGWQATLTDGTCRHYGGVVIANGHNWDPRWPDYPGDFRGRVLHSAQYKTPDIAEGRRVLVVGGGNSGFDIAVDVAPWAAAAFHSLRRQYHVLPRYLRGVPIDECGEWMLRWQVPLWMRRLGARRVRALAWSKRVARSLPRPDHRLFETHPVINSRWPYEVARGAIRVMPDVRNLEGDHVAFADGRREPIDLIIYATGYKLSFPFIDRRHLNWRNDRPELFLNIFHPHRDDLFVAGMIQPDSGQFGLVDLQAQLIAASIRAVQDGQPIARRFQQEKRVRAGESLGDGIRYVRSPRHLVEVEHHSYRRRLERWIARFGATPRKPTQSKDELHFVESQFNAVEDTAGGR